MTACDVTPATVLVIGPLPPPRHGFAVATEATVDLLGSLGAAVVTVDLGSDGRFGSLRSVLRRARRAAGAIGTVARLWRASIDTVYLGASGGGA